MMKLSDTQRREWAQHIARLNERLALDHTRVPANDATGWFIGPKAENARVLTDAIGRAIDAHLQARREYKPQDPAFRVDDTSTLTGGASALAPGDELNGALDNLLQLLQGSVPLASYRNQSHMYWDITLPSVVGYFAAMLYNQNNVAAEASPVTTALEIQVGRDLCRMVGFPFPPEEEAARETIRPWGHITCDGSIANGEAMWAARNLKFLPIALAAALRNEPVMAPARSVSVKTCRGTRARLIELSNWELLNLPVDEVVDLPDRISRTTTVSDAEVRRAIDTYSIQSMGHMAFQSQYFDNPAHANAVVFTPATAHYSWPKSAALIGFGTRAVRGVTVDDDGRMSIPHLRAGLDECLRNQWPVVQVVAVVGTTEEGAADPLDEILRVRDEYREMGLEFAVHVDGAWGGYFASMIRDAGGPIQSDPARRIDEHPELQISGYVRRQLAAFASADTLTIDPHKSGFIPYPAGGLCYRNGAMRQLIAYHAPVVYHDGRDETVGTYGIEGSKPGAAAASVYLSHAMIPLNRRGYGRLLGRCVFNSKRFFSALITLPYENDIFTVTALQRIPSERGGGTRADIDEEKKFIWREIVARESNDDLFAFFARAMEDTPSQGSPDREKAKRALRLFQEIGSDLCIVAYAFNFVSARGLNRDVQLMNEMNELMFNAMSLHPQDLVQGGIPKVDMIVTASSFERHPYGDAFVQRFAERAGVRYDPAQPVRFLISTTQNPWLTATSDGNFIGTLMQVLRKQADTAAREVMRRHSLPARGESQ